MFINIYIIYHERHASSIAATVLQYNTQGPCYSCNRETLNVPYLLHCSEMLEPGKKLDSTLCHISHGDLMSQCSVPVLKMLNTESKLSAASGQLECSIGTCSLGEEIHFLLHSPLPQIQLF